MAVKSITCSETTTLGNHDSDCETKTEKRRRFYLLSYLNPRLRNDTVSKDLTSDETRSFSAFALGGEKIWHFGS